jgi:hypothetical protein
MVVCHRGKKKSMIFLRQGMPALPAGATSGGTAAAEMCCIAHGCLQKSVNTRTLILAFFVALPQMLREN